MPLREIECYLVHAYRHAAGLEPLFSDHSRLKELIQPTRMFVNTSFIIDILDIGVGFVLARLAVDEDSEEIYPKLPIKEAVELLAS